MKTTSQLPVTRLTPDLNRRRFCAAAAAAVAAVLFGAVYADAADPNAVKPTISPIGYASANKAGLRPFRVNVPDAELTALRRRIKVTRE